MIQLYSYFRSSASYRVRIALELKNIEYEYKPIHLVKSGGEQNLAEFKVLNPMGQVPCLVDDQMILSQSMAILMYLDEKYPNPKILFGDLELRSKMIQVSEMINSGIHPIQNLSVLNEIQQRFGLDSQGKSEWARYWIHRGFQAIEKVISETAGEYAFGDELCIADLMIVPQIYNAHRFEVDMAAFPILGKIEKNCLKLDCFKKAEPSAQSDAQ
ncbi:MAG: maleylacetoacetate isomerase [Bdellovibrionales bacterium]|nr:maleylacetoacetate isomerase [Bdellovibrionales bacterium]